MAADDRTCGRCGGTVAGHLAFCTHCGSPMASGPPPVQPPVQPPIQPPVQHPPTQPAFAPPAYAPPQGYAPAPGYAPPPAYPAPPRKRRTGLVALWVVLALLVVGGGVTAAVLLLDDEPEGARVYDASDRASSTDEPSDEPSEEPTASVSAVPSETMSASPVEPTASPTPVQCWNGPAPSLADCTSPTGRAGIEWVFPSMKDADCSPAEAERAQLWNCYDYLDDGAVIRFNYSEWYSFAAAAAHYRNPGYREGYSENRLDDGRYLWLSYDLGKGQYKAALAYSRAPWSVTVYADTTAHRDAALRELLVMRPREQLRGVR